MRESVVFYKSFYDAINKLPEEYRLEVINAVMQYSFNDIIPDMTPIAEAMFTLIKVNLDKATERYEQCVENGKKGGAPLGNSNAKKQPKTTQNNLKVDFKTTENNLNDNVNVNDNVNEKENIKRKSFQKPTLDEVQNYIQEKNLNVDAKKFFDYFETGNWVDSKGNKVKNWKQKILTWSKYSEPKNNSPSNRYHAEEGQYEDLENYYTSL